MNFLFTTRRVLLTLFVSLLSVAFANAQNTRRIQGTIVDDFNNPIENVKVMVKGNNLQTQTNKDGWYSLELSAEKNITLITESINTVSAVRQISAGVQDITVNITLSEKMFGLPEIDIVGAKPQSYHSDIAYSATRMEIPVIEVPGSVEVITRKLLEDQQTNDMTDAIRNFSGVSTASSGEAANINENFTSRGFGLTNSRNYFKNGVRYLKFSNNAIANVERIEMLKGPASVLYGAVEPGGVINFITKPTLYSPKYNLSLRYGSYDFKQASADLSGPLNKKKTIRYRLNMMHEDADSFRKPVYSKRSSISPIIDFDLNNKTTLSIDGDYFRDKRTHDAGVVHNNGQVAKRSYKTFVGEPWAYGKFTDYNFGYALNHSFNDKWSARSFFRQYYTHEDRLYFQMKGVKDDMMSRRLAHWDAKINYRNFLNEISGEFDTFKIKHKVLVGFEYGYLSNRRQVEGVMYTPINIYNPTYSDRPTDLNMEKSTDLDIKQTTYALYFQDQISFTKQLKLLLGGRTDWIKDTSDNLKTNKNTKNNSFAFSPRVGFVYLPTTDFSIYLSYSQSYIPQAGETKEGKKFDPVTSKQWEIGFKKTFLHERLMASLSLYNLQKTNLPTPDPEDEEFKIQVGEQYSRGAEFTFSGNITRNWSVSANYAYTFGKVSKTNDKKLPVGKRLANMPNNSASIWTTYQLRTGVMKGLSFGGGYFFTDSRYGNIQNDVQLDAFKTVDCFVAYQRKFYKVSVNCKNIFNEEYYIGAQGKYMYHPGKPRSVVATVSLNL